MAYLQVTRAQLRTMAYARLGTLGTTLYRDDEINRYIQEALRVFNSLTGFWKKRVTLPTTTSAWYTVPGTITSAIRIEFNGVPLHPSSLWDLDNGRVNWESETTASGGGVPTSPYCWAPGGLNLIAIWPADAVGNNSLLIDGIAQTPTPANDAAFVDIGQEELKAILDYVEHIATFKQGTGEFDATMPLLQSFLKQAAKRNAILLTNAKFRQWMGLDEAREAKPIEGPERVGAR